MNTTDTLLFGDPAAIAWEAADIAIEAGRRAVAAHGRFAVALSPAFVTPAVLDALAATAARAPEVWAGGGALGEVTRLAVADFVAAQRARVVTLTGPVLAAASQIAVRAASPSARRVAEALRACRAQPDRCRPHVLARSAGPVRFLIELNAAAESAATVH